MFEDFGIDPFKVIVQMAVVLLPAVWATLRVLANRRGVSALLWLGLIWFVPLLGAVAALSLVRGPRLTSPA